MHKFITNKDKFWDFYINSVKKDLGDKFLVLDFEAISQKIPLMTTEEMQTINALIREAAQIPKKIELIYDPSATTFYSRFNTETKKYEIAYPTFTKYMMYWEPAMKFAFRHELGHIIRGDCTQNMGEFHNVWNNNTCMDIRINGVLDREGMMMTMSCLYYSQINPETQEPWELLLPEVQFPKIDLEWEDDVRYIPPWTTISDFWSKAEENANNQQPKPPPPPQGPKYKVGDYVMIDKETSDSNGEFGKVVEVDDDGEYVVEKVSREEGLAVIEGLKEQRGMMLSKSVELLGVYEEGELLPLQPEKQAGNPQPGQEPPPPPPGGECPPGQCPKPGTDGKCPGGSCPGPDGEGKGKGKGGEGKGGEGKGGEGKGGEGKGGEGKGGGKSSIEQKEDLLEKLKNGKVAGNGNKTKYKEDQEIPKEGQKPKEEPKEKPEDGKPEDGKPEDGKPGDNKGKSEDGKSKREERLEELIAEEQLKHNINRSIDNFEKIKNQHKEELTSAELNSLDRAIEELNEINK